VVCIELEDPRSDAAAREKTLSELRDLAARLSLTRGIDTFLVHPDFPVDIRHNAKIRREELALWAGGKLGPP
jgi:hypothetical protein